jgi:hypothetical protein
MTAQPVVRHQDGWYRWTPELASDARNEALADGISAFVPLENQAGVAAADWLKAKALATYPSVVTYVLWQDGIVQGFVALCATTVKLSDRQRSRLTGASVPLTPIQPATLVAWLARHRDASASGGHLLSYAVHIALQVRDLQGSVALVLDPWDEESAQAWMAQYGFRWSAPEGGARRKLWIPLFTHPD